MIKLTQGQARRIALAAQGFLDAPHSPPTMRTLARTVERTGVLQVDSVNVLARAHYMPLYSRMGPYDRDLLVRASERGPRRIVEYWAHVQAFMPVDLWPVMEFRRQHYRQQRHKWGMAASEELTSRILDRVRGEGAATARALDAEFSGPRSKEHWGWNWSDARRGLDVLFLMGELAIAGRSSQFEVIYDVPERVLPAGVLEVPALTIEESMIELVRRAARSHGVGTVKCFADYYRLPVKAAAAAVVALEAAGELTPASVEGWRRPAYLFAQARRPRAVHARALLSPFDPLVWERARAEALFDFHYRIEIYTPAHKRVHGYYVLPFLLGERLVARVDLKADRAAGVLIVQSAWPEPDAPPRTAHELAVELRQLAGWLGLADVVVRPVGGLAPALSQELAASAPHDPSHLQPPG